MHDIRTIRQHLGMAQTQLAVALGLNQSTISRLESGSFALDARTNLALEALLARHGVNANGRVPGAATGLAGEMSGHQREAGA